MLLESLLFWGIAIHDIAQEYFCAYLSYSRPLVGDRGHDGFPECDI